MSLSTALLSRKTLFSAAAAALFVGGFGGSSARADIFSDLQFRIALGHTRPEAQRVWVEPVYETRCERVWVEPVYENRCDRVWHEAVYEDRCEQVLVPDRYETRSETYRDYRSGRTVRQEVRVLVEPAHYEERTSHVLVRAGSWEDVPSRVCVAEGHWSEVNHQVVVREGYWAEQPVCDTGSRSSTRVEIGYEQREARRDNDRRDNSRRDDDHRADRDDKTASDHDRYARARGDDSRSPREDRGRRY